MKRRIAALALTAAAFAAAGPLTSAAHASECNPNIPFACFIVDTVCGGKLCQ
jgi:hypothetical protein